MTGYTVVHASDYPQLEESLKPLAESWPRFMAEDPYTRKFWHRLYPEFREFQLALRNDDTGEIVGEGNSVPFHWSGSNDDLPAGWDATLERAFSVQRPANAVSAVAVTVKLSFQGEGLSRMLLDAIADVTRRNGFEHMTACVRPSRKAEYPITPIERYAFWTRPDGSPFDPWMRVHWQRSAEIVRVETESKIITGSIAEWEAWTGMVFPDSGMYVVPGALTPIVIDRQSDTGRYVEPNVWMRHAISRSGL